jgi:hypothetical protein
MPVWEKYQPKVLTLNCGSPYWTVVGAPSCLPEYPVPSGFEPVKAKPETTPVPSIKMVGVVKSEPDHRPLFDVLVVRSPARRVPLVR